MGQVTDDQILTIDQASLFLQIHKQTLNSLNHILV